MQFATVSNESLDEPLRNIVTQRISKDDRAVAIDLSNIGLHAFPEEVLIISIVSLL